MFKDLNNRMLKAYVEKREDLSESFERVMNNQRGAGAVEYAMIIGVVVLGLLGLFWATKGTFETFFKDVAQAVADFFSKNKS